MGDSLTSVRKWLFDLRFATESECMNILQGKPLNQETEVTDNNDLAEIKSLKGKFKS